MSDIPDSNNEEDFVEVPGLDERVKRVAARLDRKYEEDGGYSAGLAAFEAAYNYYMDLEAAIAVSEETPDSVPQTTSGKISNGALIIVVGNGAIFNEASQQKLTIRHEVAKALQQASEDGAAVGVISKWQRKKTWEALQEAELISAEPCLDFALTREDFPDQNSEDMLDMYLKAIERGKKAFTSIHAISAIVIIAGDNPIDIERAAYIRDRIVNEDELYRRIFVIGLPSENQERLSMQNSCDEIIPRSELFEFELATAINNAASDVAMRYSRTKPTRRASALRHALDDIPLSPEPLRRSPPLPPSSLHHQPE